MTLRHTLLILLASLFWLSFSPVLKAQEEVPPVPEGNRESVLFADSVFIIEDSLVIDTAALIAVTDNILEQHQKRNPTTFTPDPIRALWLGLVIPGAGQFYNRKYWKLPIIYGGFLGCVYALTWNSQMLQDYSQAYLDIVDSDPNTKSYEKMLPPNYDIEGKEARFAGIFQNKKDTFRRFRDLSLFAFGGVYLLSVIDAYVDAELSTFDISPDLSLHFQPTMIETERFDMHHRRTTPGIQCVLVF